MNKMATLVAALTICAPTFSQLRITISGSTYVVLDDSVKLVLDNSSTNAFSANGSGGIISENESDQLVWAVGTSTGSYTVPFIAPGTLTVIPVNLTINSAGSGSGSIRFATFGGASWDNNTYHPSDVTHMTDFNTGAGNNSAHVADRFWIVDATGYTSKPSATMDLTYQDAELTAPGNTITESNLGAQRFNSTTGHWGDYLPQGTVNTTTNTVSGIPVSAADFFRSWTISEITDPLPLIITEMDGYCTNDQTIAQWSSESVSMVDHFDFELLDGNEFRTVATIPYTQTQEYHYALPKQAYTVYRLGISTQNGSTSYTAPRTLICESNDETEVFYNVESNEWQISCTSNQSGEEDLTIFDAAGKRIASHIIPLTKGINVISVPTDELAGGVYLLGLKNGNEFIQKRIVIPF